MSVDYETHDAEQIRVLFAGWTPDPMPSPNWRGLVSENGIIDPDPEPLGLPESPVVFAAWRIDYDVVEATYAGDSTYPPREGRIVIARYTEPGARKGALLRLRRALLEALSTASDSEAIDLVISPEAARSVVAGKVGPWYVENLVVPFAAG